MDLMRSWVAAAAAFLVGSVLMVALTVNVSSADGVAGTRGATVVSGVPSLAVYMLMTAVGASVHPAPRRDDPSRHAVAVFVVPAVTMVGSVVLAIGGGFSVAGTVASLVAGAIGAVAGWRIVGWLRSRAT
jgi:uncharacterized membrane protein